MRFASAHLPLNVIHCKVCLASCIRIHIIWEKINYWDSLENIFLLKITMQILNNNLYLGCNVEIS